MVAVDSLNAEELMPLLADLKKIVGCLVTAVEDNRRSLDSHYEILAIHGVNIDLLFKGFTEILESEDGRNNYLSSTLKEMRVKKGEQRTSKYKYK